MIEPALIVSHRVHKTCRSQPWESLQVHFVICHMCFNNLISGTKRRGTLLTLIKKQRWAFLQWDQISFVETGRVTPKGLNIQFRKIPGMDDDRSKVNFLLAAIKEKKKSDMYMYMLLGHYGRKTWRKAPHNVTDVTILHLPQTASFTFVSQAKDIP